MDTSPEKVWKLRTCGKMGFRKRGKDFILIFTHLYQKLTQTREVVHAVSGLPRYDTM
jgi:hypothetical protein